MTLWLIVLRLTAKISKIKCKSRKSRRFTLSIAKIMFYIKYNLREDVIS